MFPILSIPALRRLMHRVSQGPPRERRPAGRQRAARFKPRLEHLEDRLAPATVNWDGGGADFDWNNPLNWDTDTLPRAPDDVIIGLAFSGIPPVTHSFGTTSIHSLNSHAAINLSGGSFSLNTASVTSVLQNTLTFSPFIGTLTVLGNLTVSMLSFSNGTLTGTGNLTVSGLLTWTGGSMGGGGTTTVAPTGQLNIISPGSTFMTCSGRTIDNYGTATWTGGDFLVGGGCNFNNRPGGLFIAQSPAAYTHVLLPYTTATFNNEGTFRKPGSTGTTNFVSPSPTLELVFTNSGVVEVHGDSELNINAPFPEFAGPTLTQGTYLVSGTFRVRNANVGTNAASIVLDGPASQIVNQSGVNALANFAVNAATGSFTLLNGQQIIAPGGFSNAGALTVGPASTFGAVGYTQTAGTTRLDNGQLAAAVLVDIQGGALAGSGVVFGSLRNAARIDVGGVGAAGFLVVLGNYTQTGSGVLNVEIGGPAIASEYDLLLVTGTATLDGTLNISLVGGYVPSAGDVFLPLLCGARTGMFSTINGLMISPTRVFVPLYFDYGLLLVAYSP